MEKARKGILGKFASFLMCYLIVQVGLIGPALTITGNPVQLSETFESIAIEVAEIISGNDIDVTLPQSPLKSYPGQQQSAAEEDSNETENHSMRDFISFWQSNVPLVNEFSDFHFLGKLPAPVSSVTTPPPESC